MTDADGPADADGLAVNLNLLLRADDSKGKEGMQLGILLTGLLVVMLDVVRERVDGDLVVVCAGAGKQDREDGEKDERTKEQLLTDILHDALLELFELCWRERVRPSDDWDYVDSSAELPHEDDVKLAQTVSRWCDEVNEAVSRRAQQQRESARKAR